MAESFADKWDEAYQNISNKDDSELPEGSDEDGRHNKPDMGAIGSKVSEFLQTQGLLAQPMGFAQYEQHWEAAEINHLNLVAAELGENTAIILNGEEKDIFLDLSTGINSWDKYKGIAAAYARKGDPDSVRLLLSIFPEHSQLAENINKHLQNIEVDPDYYQEAYDPTVGPLKNLKIGHIFEIKPGVVDFRSFIENGEFNTEIFTKSLIEKIKGLEDAQNGTVYSEDWVNINDTFNNLARAYGEEFKMAAWEHFTEQYYQYKGLDEGSDQ